MSRLLAVLVVTFLMSSVIFGTNYYVDAVYGKDTNPGTSSTSPWKTIAKVNSFKFLPGDAILFKRGAAWYETLNVNQSGTSSAGIRYDAYGSGNPPLIDGSMSRRNGIYVGSKEYITIKNFKVQNTQHASIYITASRYVTVKYCQLYVTGHGGVFIQESNNCYIAVNWMTTPATFFNAQTDGIYAQRNSNNTYDKNNIVISNQHTSQHCDAIQFYQETNATVCNNYVEQNNTKGGNAQGIYCSDNSGVFRIFNNVGYGMYTTSSLIKFKNYNTTGRSEIIGNTLYGGKGALVQTNDANIVFKNNIIVTVGSYPVASFEKAFVNKSNVNNNIYKRNGTGSTLFAYAGSSYTMSIWKSSGMDINGAETDPKFAGVAVKDFNLTSGSPALNKGANLSSPYNVDRIGTPRPYGTCSDIGAFETKLLAKSFDEDITTENQENIPESFGLSQNFPNPFNPSTTIRYTLPENSDVSLRVYDITGSQVAELINNAQNAGTYEITFNASKLASGTYIYILKAKDFTETRKMILLK